MISRISEEGVLSEWNARNPSRRVVPGDSIVEVNGLTAPWAIMEEMTTAMTVDMVVRRALPEASVLLERCATAVTDQTVQRTAFLLKRTVRARDIFVDTCAICMEDVEAEERLASLPCGHGYHQKCIIKWMGRPGASGCPLCRGGRRVPPARGRSSPLQMEKKSGCRSREGSGSSLDLAPIEHSAPVRGRSPVRCRSPVVVLDADFKNSHIYAARAGRGAGCIPNIDHRDTDRSVAG
jgi:hypothetical protein